MDRDRLKDVQTSDLKESRVNEDFVGFLKSWGPLFALIFLVPIASMLFYFNFKDAKAAKDDAAFRALSEATLPVAYGEVAAEFADVGTVAIQANIRAGQAYLNAIRVNASLNEIQAAQISGQPLSDAGLDAEVRTKYLNDADMAFTSAFESILAEEGSTPNPALSLLAVTALSGRAAVADARGDLEAAKDLYERAAARAGDGFPHLRASQEQLVRDIENRRPVRPWEFETSTDGPFRPSGSGKMLQVDTALESIALPAAEDDGSTPE